MPGMIANRDVVQDPINIVGPVALHPIAVLTFEQVTERWGTQRRSDAVRRVFGCSVTYYVQYLQSKVLADEANAEVAPAVFARLISERDHRRELRYGAA
jgi:hypothetical protein